MTTAPNDRCRPDRPDIARAFASLESSDAISTRNDFLAYVRKTVSSYGAVSDQHDLGNVTVIEVDAAGVHCEYIVPEGTSGTSRIVYVHGGGWIAGSARSYRPLAALIARTSGLAVLTVDYALAPESPFPNPLEDCRRALTWAAENGPADASNAPVFLAGDSAGANLVAATCLRQIETDGIMPQAIALLSGVLDLKDRGFVAPRDPVSNAEALNTIFGLYAQGAIAADAALVSPIEASLDMLAMFPPTLVQVSSDEYLLPASQGFCERLSAAGTRNVLSVWPAMPHAWHTFVELLPESRAAVGEIARFFEAWAHE